MHSCDPRVTAQPPRIFEWIEGEKKRKEGRFFYRGAKQQRVGKVKRIPQPSSSQSISSWK